MYSGDQNHLGRNWNVIDHKSLNFVIVDSLVFLSRQNPETNACVWIEVSLGGLNAVFFISDLVNKNLFVIFDIYLVLGKDNVKHLLEFSCLGLIFFLSKNDHFVNRVGLKHFTLAVSMKVGILIKLKLLVPKDEFSWVQDLTLAR